MRRNWSRVLAGLLVMALGVLLLLNNLGLTDIRLDYILATYWPLLLIAAALDVWRKHTRDPAGLVMGFLLFFLGGALLGRNLGWFDLDLRGIGQIVWPAMLILLGVWLLLRRGRDQGTFAFMGGLERKKGWELKDTRYTAVMGGITLDLGQAAFSSAQVDLELSAFMGGIEILVPADITITCKGVVLLGGIEFLGEESGGVFTRLHKERHAAAADAPVVNISARVMMGGIELKAVR